MGLNCFSFFSSLCLSLERNHTKEKKKEKEFHTIKGKSTYNIKREIENVLERWNKYTGQ
jgi:hypothetical protein